MQKGKSNSKFKWLIAEESKGQKHSIAYSTFLVTQLFPPFALEINTLP